jgi:hypothetical protein
MTDKDIRQIPLPRRYALLLGPLLGAAAGCSGFLSLDWFSALVMVALFAIIGSVAGVMLYVYDVKRRKQ